jgi:Dyp-type peroxidase family
MATTSNHLRGASELMLVAPIKDGFVDHPSRLISYATRLGHLLEVLLQGRRVASEVNLLPGAGPLERLDTIFSTQWAVRQRPQRSELIVSAVFDSSWEAYMRSLQTNTGELLDAIFCHCEGYEQHTCVDHGYEAFSAWLRDHQVQTRFFHSAAPELTVSDLRGLRRFAVGEDPRGAIDSVEQTEARIRNRWPALGAEAQRARAVEREQALKAMAALAESFSKDEPFTDSRTERQTYDAAIHALLSSSLDASLQDRARELGLLPKAALPNAALPASKPEGASSVPALDAADIQHNILRTDNEAAGWNTKTKHGCLVMLQCDDAPAAARLLASLLPRIATAEHPDKQQINVALTHAGLMRLEPGEAALELLPPEFREGMASRAGLLGDVGPYAHPHTWERLQVNWPKPSPRTASLSSVDVVLLVQRAVPPAQWTENDHVFDAAHPLFEDLRQLDQALELEKNGVHILHVQALRRYASDHFHLGEESHAASQPLPIGSPSSDAKPAKDAMASKHAVPLGEVLLGHRNRHGRVAECAVNPDGKWLFENGTFLVVRKLQQDVEAFERYIGRSASQLGVEPPEVKCWALGRHPTTGRTLVDPDAPDPGNEFDYSSPGAAHCPLHAHVRRANPRLADTPRILRRSFPYGSDHAKAPEQRERGLVFMAYNASIAEQFEVIQRWLNGGNATALPSFVNDLIAGVPQLAGAERWLPGAGDRLLPPAEQPFVSLRWGLYLFVPSMSALAGLANLAGRMLGSVPRYKDRAAARRVTRRKNRANAAAPGTSARRAQRPLPAPEPAPSGALEPLSGVEDHGLQIIADIFDIEDLEHQRQAWKEVLEEPARVPDANAVWAAIRNPTLLARLADEFPRYAQALRDSPPFTLPTPYGLLVSLHAHAREIFGDDGSRFSVEEYEKRLDVTLGGHYLGLDRYKAQYAKLAPHANAYLARLPFDGVYSVAKAAASGVLATAPAAEPQPGSVSLPGLALTGIGAVAAQYLFTPESVGPSLAQFVKPFIPISRHCFQPYPGGKLENEARRARAALIPREGGAPLLGPFAAHLRDKVCGADSAYDDDRLVRSAMVGAMVGFAPPAVAHVATILSRWLESGELERHSRKNPRARLQAVIRAMTEVPVPATVYRKIKPGARLEGRELLPLAHSFDTEFVVVGTQSVTLDARQQRLAAGMLDNPVEWQWLFAGDRFNTSATGNAEDATPSTHGCPARHAAVAAVLGVIDAVSEHPNARLCGPLELIPDPFARKP